VIPDVDVPDQPLSFGLWRGASFQVQVRAAWAVMFVMFTVIGFSGGISAKGLVSWFVLFGLVGLGCEWRARRMGLRITVDGIEAVRPFDTVSLRWEESERFFQRPAAYGLWGDQTFRVQKQRFLGQRVPDGVGMKLPTLGITSQSNPLGRVFGTDDAICGDRRISQDELLASLNLMLESVRVAHAAAPS
jgi:hypothetical protein